MTSDTSAEAPQKLKLSRFALYTMAVASGIAVANIYYDQPMLGIMEHDFPTQKITGYIPTATQLGYALGLLFLLPIGDIVDRRKLIAGQFFVLSLALVFAALAPTAWTLLAASLFAGASATVAQQIVPLAATLATPKERGGLLEVLALVIKASEHRRTAHRHDVQGRKI